ncbi:SDR family NAD(P)-dependent oxidoreductase [Cryptosporangium sp. NPDC048952]|uniref:SDR family NAD(P)-dependent oxidoreductase n=1 Tax=Cryptosporangium sp. NPDC048952 TaxID=3363961 RepID=UPI003723DF11
MPENEHAGKVALITGGGRGFGKAFGAALTALGAHVVLADVDGEAASEAAAELNGKGGSATGVACDVTDEARVGEVVAEIVGAHGGLDILINNAGLHSAAYNKPSVELGVERLRRLFDVNVMGVVVCTLAAADAMRGRLGASIVNLSSSASYPNRTAYGVSKLAVRGLTAQFAHELGREGIRVNGIAPGLIFTDTLRAELPESEVARVMSGQVLSREGAETDIVEALLYLVSRRASFITGETLRVSGGFTLSV